MHGFTLSIPLGTEVGPLQVPKGCGVQVGGDLMTIDSWPCGCPELVESSGVIHGNWGPGHQALQQRPYPKQESLLL